MVIPDGAVAIPAARVLVCSALATGAQASIIGLDDTGCGTGSDGFTVASHGCAIAPGKWATGHTLLVAYSTARTKTFRIPEDYDGLTYVVTIS